MLLAAVIVLAIILLLYNWRYSAYNTASTEHCASGTCASFNVHREHHDPAAAAALLSNITARNAQLLEHLRTYTTTLRDFNADHANKIDVIDVPEMLRNANGEIVDSQLREYLLQRIEQLLQRYDENSIREISPLNPEGNTSYAENKRRLVFCLRDRAANVRGEHELVEENLLMFVNLHELAHIMNDRWGHGPESNFWPLFKFLLQEAVKIGIYEPENYALRPRMYCGLEISHSPLF